MAIKNNKIRKPNGSGVSVVRNGKDVDINKVTSPEGNPVKISEGSRRGIRFNPDGSIDVQEAGENQSQRLTRKEFDGLQGRTGGITNDKVANIKNTQEVNSELARRQESASFESQIFDAQLKQLREKQGKESLIQPEPLAPNQDIASSDAFDISKSLGAGVAGATAGAAVGSIVPGVGTAVGAVVGGLSAGISTFFYGQAGDKKQNIKTAKERYNNAADNIDQLLNDANNGANPAQIRLDLENQYNRIIQAQQEVEVEGQGMFGKKLSKNTDELEEIENWLRGWERRRTEIELAMLAPNPSKIKPVTLRSETDITQ